ncbi:MAG TPA: hypothetical protein VMN60_03565 [Longimicrobiales bacterium]|nr:hypothetical protein [Longimicrobiales bacterium]
MSTVRRFLLAELLWGGGIFLLVLPLAILGSDAHGAADYYRWLTRALGLAAFPAGIAVAGDVLAHARPWRALVVVLGVATGIGVVLLAIVLGPVLGADALTLPQLMSLMTASGASWETRNHAAWVFYSTLLVCTHPLLMAAIGVQAGAWAPHALPVGLRRLLYWLIGIGLVVSDYAVSDSTYEVVVLHTTAYADFAAFYGLLLPLGICAGLALPTLALLRGATIHGRDH